MYKRVVITGLGAVTPIGNTVSEYWDALLAGKSGAAPIQKFDTTKFKTHFACAVKNLAVGDYLDRKTIQRADTVIQYGLIAADQAMADAGLLNYPDKTQIGIFWSSGIGGVDTLYSEITQYVKGDGTPRFTPLLVPKMIVDGACGQIAIRHGLRGVSGAIVTACASSAHALGFGLDQIRLGRVKMMLVGGSEAAISEVGIGAFSALGALSKRNDSPETASRPFDHARDGFVLGEGAAGLVLEELEHALARGAKIYAELAGAGFSCDAYHLTAPNPEGTGVAQAIAQALENAGIQSQDIDMIKTHATSTPLGDEMEIKSLEKAFGEHLQNINITAPKSMTGHLLGAAGAVEAVAVVLALQNGMVPPTINLNQRDASIPENLNLTANIAQRRDMKAALCNNFGFGGHNASLVFKKWG
jgi:3-oxoacyl-[acyl-carrier-protein] synthase II